MSDRSGNKVERAFALIAEEPFRLFFSTGAFLGVVGVGLWVAYYAGWTVAYPNISHARLMIEGFMASFIFGFLATAGPRLMGTPHFSVAAVATIFTLNVLAAGAHVGEAHRFGDICFLGALLIFMAALYRRFRRRKDSPPPNFALAGLGLVSGLVGAAMLVVAEGELYSRTYQIGNALLSQCFVLLPVLGVAPFFIRRLLDLPAPEEPEREEGERIWRKEVTFALITGVAIIVSVPLEILYAAQFGLALRAIAFVIYMAKTLPWRGRTFLAEALRFSILTVAAGFVWLAVMPMHRLAALHLVFISGFNLIVFAVATRVVFGHSGNLGQLSKRLPFFYIMSAFLVLAMLSRVAAEFSPHWRVAHLVSAAVCWLIGAIIWMVRVVPKVRLIELEEGPGRSVRPD